MGLMVDTISSSLTDWNEMSTTRIHVPSSNLRELGGYETVDGSAVRYGLIFRCGHMSELTEDEHDAYQDLKLKMIVDLRRDDEVLNRPTPLFGGEQNLHISVSDPDNAFAEAAAKAHELDAGTLILSDATRYYREVVTDNLHRYIPVFDRIFDVGNLPLLFHCTAGKDRTGFVAAAILKFLGVPDETVFEDYLLTNKLLAERTEKQLKVWTQRISKEKGIDESEVSSEALNALRILMLTHVDMLQSTFDAVDEKFGSWDEMRRDGLKISDERMDAFRGFALERTSS